MSRGFARGRVKTRSYSGTILIKAAKRYGGIDLHVLGQIVVHEFLMARTNLEKFLSVSLPFLEALAGSHILLKLLLVLPK